MIYVVRDKATPEQVREMLQSLKDYIKLAVDVRREILAGGGALHADCESALLEDGSQQVEIWGADWNPTTQEVTYESLINIRPTQGNRSIEIQDTVLRVKVERIVRDLLEGVSHV